jgi:flagellar protein FliO/FliZ
MDWDQYVRALLYLVLVLGLIGLCTWLIRRFGGGPVGGRGSRRLAVVESIALDARHRLVLVRRDGTEHLLLLGPGHDLVVEAGIPGAPPALPRALAEAGP